MNVLDDLVPLLDKSYEEMIKWSLNIKRRCNNRFRVIPERRMDADRRKFVDRRKVPNERRVNRPERRQVF